MSVVAMLCGIHFWKIVNDFWNCHSKLIKAVELFPGPRTIPLLGNALEFATNPKNAINVMAKFGMEYSTYRLWIGSKLFIIITNPKDIEIVMESPKTSKKAFFYKFMEPVVINSMINGHGPKMRANRKIQEPLINGKCLPFFMETFNKQVRRYINDLNSKLNQEEFDISDESEYCVADMLFETVIGIPGVGQDNGDLTIPHALETALDILFQRIVTPWLHPTFIFNLSKCGREFNAALELGKDRLQQIINEKKQLYMALARGDPGVEEPKPSILDLLIQNVLETNAMNDQEIISDMIAIIVGFYDAVLGIFSFTILMLAIHPDMQDKVREEVAFVIGADDDVVITNIGKLNYTRMAIQETIRLFPVGPFLSREITDDLQIDKYILPKGSTVAMLPLVTHKSPKYWHEPDKFYPERFLPKNSKNRHPFAYVPFSGGSRSCPGSKFGMSCLHVMVAHFIRKYQVMTTMSLEDIKLRTHISVRSLNGYKVSIKNINQL
ncbi:hypothetical protein PV328_009885 [Microctonus aethiopoides]|uniref:Cytochrome P450 n=1 Tax=Microctonus aethiopoides TaxID=144406 RepID=A0AA39C6S3_9HYME|nr:hypothetical protein PV328_009885 [Microctonus aethiopoides]